MQKDNRKSAASPEVKVSKGGDRQPKRGRPSVYSEQVAETICACLMRGWSLVRICQLDEMPAEDTVYGWLAKGTEHPFSERYARAREIQAERMADELLDIADDTSRDTVGELGMPNNVAVQRDRLRADTRKWVAAKLLPKKYGERLELGGEVSVSLADRISKARQRVNEPS